MKNKIIITIILVLLIGQTSIFAEKAVFTTEKVDKYTLRITLNYKETSQNGNIEITSYNPDYANKTVKIFYKKTDKSGRNTIDIDTRSFYSGIRILLENVDTMKLPFNDIEGIEGEEAIRHLHDAGLVNGSGDGSFNPGGTITRGEFFAMMVRALNIEKEENISSIFNDTADHWAEDEIMAAYNIGLVKGYEDGTVKPDEKITIGQVGLVIDRAFDLNIYDDMIYSKIPNDHYASYSMKRLFNAKILNTADSIYNNFNIDKNATRAECAIMISRALTN